MPWTGGQRSSVFGNTGTPTQPPVSGGGSVGGAGGGLPSGGASGHNLDEFVALPFIAPPPGAALTGTSSLQRAFPERIGGNLFQQEGEQPNLFEQALQIPAQTAAQPLALADKITNGGVNDFLTQVSQNAPFLRDVIDTAGEGIQRFFSVPAAMMNHDPTVAMRKLWNHHSDETITPELLMSVGLPPDMANQFKKNGAPILGWFGVTGDQMTVGDLQEELKNRNFLKDPETGKNMTWGEWAMRVGDNPLGDFSMGHASANENAIADFLLQSAGQLAEISALTIATGGIGTAIGLGAKGGRAIGEAQQVIGGIEKASQATEFANAVSGVGRAAQAAGRTERWWNAFRSPIARVAGKPGDGLLNEMVADGVVKPVASSVAKGAAELAAGDATGAGMRSFAKFGANILKAVTYPEVGFAKGSGLLSKTLYPLWRYQVGQTRLRAGMFAVEQGTGFLQDQGVPIGPLADVHEFMQGVLDDHVVSDNAVFATAAAFTFPFKAATKDLLHPISSPVGNALGRTYDTLGRRAMQLLEADLGKGAIKELGGVEKAAMWMDRMAQTLAMEKRMPGLPEGIKAKWETTVEAGWRMSLINNSVKALADMMIRKGEITAADLVRKFREVHESPTRVVTREDGVKYHEKILPFQTRLSNEEIISRANLYDAALQGIANPIVGIHTAVLARAGRMSLEDLDVAIQAAEAAAKVGGGKIDAQFIRDLFYKTPGMLDDPFLNSNAHEFFVKHMNPALNEALDANDVIGLLKNLRDVTLPRDQMWHELAARDAAAAPDAIDVQPGGVYSSGVARNIHSGETAKRFQIEADARLRVLQAEKQAMLEEYRATFSKRGKYKPSISDQNWHAEAPKITEHMAANEVGNFSATSGRERGYTKGFDVPAERLGVVPEGDAAGLVAAARAIRLNPDYKYADIRITPSLDMPGYLDVAPSYHFPTQAAAEAKAAEMQVGTIFDSSKKINPEKLAPTIPVDAAVLDAKAAEIADAMSLTGEQAAIGVEILKVLAQTNARRSGGSPIDYLNNIEFVKGGKPQAQIERLFQTEVQPLLDALTKNGMGPSQSLRETVTLGGEPMVLTDGPMTLGDAWLLKLQAIHPKTLLPAERTSLYQRLFEAQARPAAGDPVDAFRRAVFSMLSPNNNLTNNEIGLAALGIRTFKDVERIANSSRDAVTKEIMAANAGKLGIGNNAGRIVALAKRLVKDRTALDIRPGEAAGEYLTRIATENGFNMKTANFMAMMANPAEWTIGTVDVHIVRSLIEGELSTFLKPGELDPALVARYKARRGGGEGGLYPQPSARTTTGGKIYEGSDYQKFADALSIALERKYPEAPFGAAGRQWMAWDEIRNRFEPHTAVWPETSALPRLNAQELRAAKAVHTDANYMAKGVVGEMPQSAVFFQREPARDFQQVTDHALFEQAKAQSTRAENLSPHSPEEFAASQAFMTPDRKAGFMLSPEGDLQNVFNNSTTKGMGAKAVESAIQMGARTLDAYDGFLPGYYSKFGFRETGRMKFVDEYAPAGWDYAKLGRPDVVFMALDAKPVRGKFYTDWELAKSDSLAASSVRLDQRGGRITKGSIEFPPGTIRSIVRGYEAADFSTFVHEVGHNLRRTLPTQDLAIVEKHYNVAGSKWSKPQEEQFARHFERYLRDGKPPTKALEPVFAKIAQWMRAIYNVLRGTPLADRVSPEVRAVFDRALGKVEEPAAIQLAGSTPQVGPAIDPIVFKAEDAALVIQREEMRSNIHRIERESYQTRNDIAEVRQRAKLLKGGSIMDESWHGYNPDGSPKTNFADIQRVEGYVQWVRENYPQFDVVAGPRLMNLYTPDTNFLKTMMIENDATAQALFEWGTVSKINNALWNAVDSMTRPIRGRVESRDTVSRIYEVLMKMGAKTEEVDTFLTGVNDVLMADRTIGFKNEQIPIHRGMNSLGARQLSQQAVGAFGSNREFVQKFAERFGGQGLERMWMAVTEAYNPAIRAIQRKIEQGGKVGRMQRLLESGYDAYHTQLPAVSSGTHMLAKFIYPLFRFALNPMYHVYNTTEADIIGITQDGLRVATGRGSSKYSPGVFRTLERGNPEAYQSLMQGQRKAKSMGLDPVLADVQDSLVRGATLDQTGTTFGLNTRRSLIIERQVDFRRPETIAEAIKTFAKDDPAMRAALERYGGNVDDWVTGLTEDIYGIDNMGARKYVQQLVQNEGWTQQEYNAMRPLVDQIVNRMQAQFDDMYQIHVGNVNRSRLERVVNSYWLFWPASYMLKANKWLFKVMTEGAFGYKTGLGGAWALNEMSRYYHRRYIMDDNFRQLIDDNKDLEFAISQVMPIVPWSDGVSLNRLTRYMGGWVGLWPQYQNFDPEDVGGWAGKMAEIGPLYSFKLFQSIKENIGKDFNWEGGPFPNGILGGNEAPSGGSQPLNAPGL